MFLTPFIVCICYNCFFVFFKLRYLFLQVTLSEGGSITASDEKQRSLLVDYRQQLMAFFFLHSIMFLKKCRMFLNFISCFLYEPCKGDIAIHVY